ncbi:TPA: hypothetical protein ACFNMI_000536 [Neisseria bacilliformis]|uniref:hypothetical protein n=1 Tax=Neisseria bacilliformis TaxID=267212 RepID=UPI0006673454|nr:hypothetical protein [Neisseria bacilliformis]
MKILTAFLLALLTTHAAAQPPAADALKLPENVRIITAQNCRNEILRMDVLFRTYLGFCPQSDVMKLAGSDKRLNNAFQRQGYLIEDCKQHGGLNPEKAIASIPNLSPLMDLAEREPEPPDAEIAAKAAPFCTANRAAFQRLMEWHNPQ